MCTTDYIILISKTVTSIQSRGGVLLMQASDVTDRWLLIVQEIWCVGPPKATGCSGNYQTSLELEGRECSDCAR